MTHDSSERPIVLIGMMGAGKSLVGAQLARNLGCPFRDVDALVEARVGMSVADVFRDRGEHAFRDHEASVLQSVLGSSEFCVVSTGGGAVLREESVAQMRAHGIVVWLRASIDTLAARLGSGAADRPLLAGGDLGEQLASLAQERNELYRAAANVIVDTDGMEPSEIADAVLAELRLGGDSQRAVVHVRGIGSDYDICIEPASFNQIADRVRGVRQVVMVTQRNLLEPWASQLEDVLGRHGIHHSTITIDDGEDAKRLST
ncbi:MAG: shikimate kinase, partial [Acidimicrobiia bacterium]